MLSRRDFLKITGIASVAAASGFAAGKILGGDDQNLIRVQAYIPDESSAAELTKIISRNGSKDLVVRLEKLKHQVKGDILVSDSKSIIYNPDLDFNGALVKLRTEFKKANAAYCYTAYSNNENFLTSLLKSGTPVVVIEDENGIKDQIKLSLNKDIVVKGPLGKTGITIKDNSVHISSSCCRNGICSQSGIISGKNEMIACAPNRILIRIDRA
jgi:hypothetical protein